jgi:hypothetical protein
VVNDTGIDHRSASSFCIIVFLSLPGRGGGIQVEVIIIMSIDE